ncbi:MAG: beta-propeller fold lactonase family protein, partial [Acidimicrobiales bacterium]|nr:beta-propeller fold lactonase family protein [Acidimicrobiales bacterium]
AFLRFPNHAFFKAVVPLVLLAIFLPCSLLLANNPPTGAVTITGTATQSQTLTADNNLADADGLGTITYQWYRDGVPITYGGTLKNGVNGVDGLDGPQQVIISPDGLHAYVTGKFDNSVSWYQRNASTGALTYVGVLKDGAGGVDGLWSARGVALSANGAHAYVAAEGEDAISWYQRNASTGELTYGGVSKDGAGGVANLNYVQMVTISADGSHLYAASQFDNALNWFSRNAGTGALTYGGSLTDGVGGVDGLDWVNSVILSPDGAHAYAAAWNDDAVSWFERNATTGALTYGGMLKDGVGGVDGLDYVKAITISPDGKHAYVTGSDDDSVSWFERNASTGALTYAGTFKDGVGGIDGLDGASGVTISPDGWFAYVVSELDDSVSWFTRDPFTGALFYAASDANYTLTQTDVGKVITVTASYVDGGTTTESVTSAGTAAVQAANSTPVITSYGGAATASVNAPENQTFATDVNASDADGNATVSYLISGGADQTKFDLNATSGVLTFKTAPDFEIPTDLDANNTYVVEVNASDGTAWDLQTITVTVTDVTEIFKPTTMTELQNAVNLWVSDNATALSTYGVI